MLKPAELCGLYQEQQQGVPESCWAAWAENTSVSVPQAPWQDMSPPPSFSC